MRTIAPVMVVMAIGVAAAMLGMAGFGGAWGAQPPQTDLAEKQVEKGEKNVGPSDAPVSGPVTSTDSSIVGLIVSGLASLVEVGSAVVVLPITLMELGFPAWFAVPIGSIAEMIVGIGLIEFATQREWT